MLESFKSAVFNQQRRAWEEKRRRGRRAFILYRGMLKWGGIMFFLTLFTNVFGRHRKLDWLFVVSALIACPFAGFLWARSMWFLNERRYSGARKQQDSSKKS